MPQACRQKRAGSGSRSLRRWHRRSWGGDRFGSSFVQRPARCSRSLPPTSTSACRQKTPFGERVRRKRGGIGAGERDHCLERLVDTSCYVHRLPRSHRLSPRRRRPALEFPRAMVRRTTFGRRSAGESADRHDLTNRGSRRHRDLGCSFDGLDPHLRALLQSLRCRLGSGQGDQDRRCVRRIDQSHL